MRTDSSYPPQSPYPPNRLRHQGGDRKRFRWLQSLLLIGFSVFAFVSLFALIALWWFFGITPTAANDTVLAVHAEQVRPELALMYLAGDPVDALAGQALSAGEYATSQALVTFGVNAMLHPRVASILQLAQRYRDAGDPDTSLQLLRYVRAIAVLDNSLTPLERAEVLLACATDFFKLDQEAEAVDAASQVQRIAEQTPDMLPATRNDLLQDLTLLANQLPDELLREQARELARNPYITPSGLLIQEKLPVTDGSIEFEQQLMDLIYTRQQLARQLAEYRLQGSEADSESLVNALTQALLAEDAQRSLYFNQIFSSDNLTFSLQFWFVAEHRRWVILKLAVAKQAFGLSLVPAWETAQGEILRELIEVTDNLQAHYLTLAQTQPEPLAQLQQRIVVMRWFALQAEVGLYPERLTTVSEALRVAQGEFHQFGTSAALPVSYQLDAIPPGFRIETNR